MTESDDGGKCEALKPLTHRHTHAAQDCDTDTTHCPSGPCVILLEAEAVVTSEFVLNATERENNSERERFSKPGSCVTLSLNFTGPSCPPRPTFLC